MFREVFLCVAFVFAFSQSASVLNDVNSQTKCNLPFGDYAFYSPLVFSQEGKLLKPKSVNGVQSTEITLNFDQTVVLSCTPNFFRTRVTERHVLATCKNDKTLIINGVEVNYKDLSCELRTVEEVLSTVYGCPSQYRGVTYGFTNPITEKSYILGESCYSTQDGRTLFAHIKLRQQNNTIDNIALKIDELNYFTRAHPSYHNKIQFLKAVNAISMGNTLKQLLGRDNVPTFTVHNYIEKEFLTNPQFQSSIPKFTWNSFVYYNPNENEHNNLELLNEDIQNLGVVNLELYKGSHGVLSLPKSDGTKVEINLKDDKYPVPNVLWTVVKTEDRATGFIIFNNPTMTQNDIVEADKICKSKCNEITWLHKLLLNDNYKTSNYGYVLCCDINSFKNYITELPDLVDVVRMFK